MCCRLPRTPSPSHPRLPREYGLALRDENRDARATEAVTGNSRYGVVPDSAWVETALLQHAEECDGFWMTYAVLPARSEPAAVPSDQLQTGSSGVPMLEVRGAALRHLARFSRAMSVPH